MHNASARVFHSNQSLVLQKVTRHSSGRYACSAINAEGETVSNELHFTVKCEYGLYGDDKHVSTVIEDGKAEGR